MIEKRPLMNVRYATDSFNWLRRLNDQARVAKINRDGQVASVAYSNLKMYRGWWVDWKPEVEKIVQTERNIKCYSPIVGIRRIKVWLFKTHKDVYYSLKCKVCTVNLISPKKQ